MTKEILSKVGSKLLVVVTLLLLVGVPVHYWTVDKKGVLRAVYPATALFSSWTASCSKGAPQWQSEIMDFGLWEFRAAASQSVFIDVDKNLHHCETGWEGDVFASPRVTVNSKFQYGSLTKPITSALVLTLINQGNLELEQSVSDIFDNVRPKEVDQAYKQVTVGRLMSFKAGVSGEVFVEKQRAWCPYKTAEIYQQKPWLVESGGGRYSNLSYCILGSIISEVSGETYRSAVQKTFELESYGVRFVDAPSQAGWVVPDYRYHDFYRDDIEPSFDYFAISATGGMGGSAEGYAKLIRRIMDSPLKQYLAEEKHECNIKNFKNCYGYMFYVYEPKENKVMHVKEGHMPGFTSLVVVTEKKEVFVWVGNSDTPNARSGKLMKQALNFLADQWL